MAGAGVSREGGVIKGTSRVSRGRWGHQPFYYNSK